MISDVIMPNMNGIEAAISIRGFLPGCKISSSPGRLRPRICWRMPARKATNLNLGKARASIRSIGKVKGLVELNEAGR